MLYYVKDYITVKSLYIGFAWDKQFFPFKRIFHHRQKKKRS